LRAAARVRVQEPLRICLECRSKSKKCDKQLTHIVRVRCRVSLKIVYRWIKDIFRNDYRQNSLIASSDLVNPSSLAFSRSKHPFLLRPDVIFISPLK